MAERKIVPFGDPILRKKAKPVEQITPKIKKLLDDMTDTIYAKEGRAALAAPQVGILRQVIVIDGGDKTIELINPEIIEKDGEQIGPEGCLSFPGYTGIVKRARFVKVRTLNREGNTWILEAENYLARCVQHEIDHLHGVLYVDHVQNNMLYNDQTNKPVSLLDVLRLTYQQ
jgi:peptide deformylase